MNKILEKLINDEIITDADIVEELHDVCDRVHASCDSDCPVFAVNNKVPWNLDKSNCRCHKDGLKMLKFIRDSKQGKNDPPKKGDTQTDGWIRVIRNGRD